MAPLELELIKFWEVKIRENMNKCQVRDIEPKERLGCLKIRLYQQILLVVSQKTRERYKKYLQHEIVYSSNFWYHQLFVKI